MNNHLATKTIGVLGSGTMGAGIAQVAATYGHTVIVVDNNSEALSKAEVNLEKLLKSLVEKNRLTKDKAQQIQNNHKFYGDLASFANCDLVIEAIIENRDIKQQVFSNLEQIVRNSCILATNTSSLSITSIASACKNPQRVIGIHFFNPAPLMPLVEIIPGITTAEATIDLARSWIAAWGKTTVLAKDTPGFIVNRVARPFYGEALRILEEGITDVATIDWAMRDLGGFRMGPFELMDLIGNDINYAVTESVFQAFYYDPRYKPSLTQKRLCEAKHFGRKAGRGFYDYTPNTTPPSPNQDKSLGEKIFRRILLMLINEAVDAVFLQIASPTDIDLAMTKGVNYPKGLLKWGEQLGWSQVLGELQELHHEYGEDRYRPSVLLRKMVRTNGRFFPDQP